MESTALVRLEPATGPLGTPHRNPALIYLGRLAPGSRRTMAQSLTVVTTLLSGGRATPETLDWGSIHYSHVATLRQALADRYAPATANKILCALRGVLKEACTLEQMDAEAYQRARGVAGIRAESLPAGRALTDGELRALFSDCAQGGGARGARDAAILALLYGVGLRRSEAVGLRLDQYDPQQGKVRLRGKGKKERMGYPAGGAREALEAWLRVRGEAPGPLLCPVDRWGHLRVRRMTDQAVRAILLQVAARARVAKFSPHDLRRTFISNLLDAGADISRVKELAGHRSIVTTQRYDRRGERANERAAGLLHVPYEPPATGTSAPRG